MVLIEGYISDDSFMDFRDGLILLGREAIEAAIADPDSLAEHCRPPGAKEKLIARGVASRSRSSRSHLASRMHGRG
jgi:hypothetical protein